MHILFGTVLAVSSILGLAEPAIAAGPALTAEQARAIRGLVTTFMEAHHAPGATFAIGLDDRIVWTEGFGFADLRSPRRAFARAATTAW